MAGRHMQNLKSFFHSLGTFVHPSGIEQPIHQCIDAMESLHGDRQGKRFRVWVDQLSSAQIGSNTWLVKFKKWESYGEGKHCCLTTILMSSKAEIPNEFIWLHMHQTWLDGFGVKQPETWLL